MVLNYTKEICIYCWESMGPIVADMFLFCYERDFIVESFNLTDVIIYLNSYIERDTSILISLIF